MSEFESVMEELARVVIYRRRRWEHLKEQYLKYEEWTFEEPSEFGENWRFMLKFLFEMDAEMRARETAYMTALMQFREIASACGKGPGDSQVLGELERALVPPVEEPPAGG